MYIYGSVFYIIVPPAGLLEFYALVIVNLVVQGNSELQRRPGLVSVGVAETRI